VTAVQRVQDFAFQRTFSKLFVYNILFEDAEVDERFLKIEENSKVLSISGAGCGVAGHVTKRPESMDVVDINPHHLALTALKTTAAQHMRSYDQFFALAGRGWVHDPKATIGTFAHQMPRWIQRYWKRHANRFERSIYDLGMTARMLQVMRRMARVDAAWLRDLMQLELSERGRVCRESFQRMFNHPAIRLYAGSPLQLMSLGINFTQRDRLLETEGTDIISYFLDHMSRLAVTDLETNWFVWYFITGRFNLNNPDGVPPYLRRDRHESSYKAPTAVRYHNQNIFDVLGDAAPKTWTHYTFCDAVDWMPEKVQRRLLDEVRRTSRDGAIMMYRSVEDDCVVQRHGMERMFQPLVEETREASALDRTKQYRRVNLYRVVH
jgi:S-adenosylmethionine-diacylglycerol 3-amino-3-carboxypropyl transferase